MEINTKQARAFIEQGEFLLRDADRSAGSLDLSAGLARRALARFAAASAICDVLIAEGRSASGELFTVDADWNIGQ